ncbi:hypothetical protein niasHT_009277 [Heterodera trifolii]|uniref:Superoxide dismutase copper/zinc binding domain-containing protein n=1 Tax=Heterodera trifolii TaxID=157864 RepID=A0ABD2MCE6_9BILA
MSRNRLPPELLLEIVLCVRRGPNTPNICFSSRILRTFMEPRVALWRRVWISMLHKLSDAYQKAILTTIWNYVPQDENCQMFFQRLEGVFHHFEDREITANCLISGRGGIKGQIRLAQAIDGAEKVLSVTGQIHSPSIEPDRMQVHDLGNVTTGSSSTGRSLHTLCSFASVGAANDYVPADVVTAPLALSGSKTNCIGRSLVVFQKGRPALGSGVIGYAKDTRIFSDELDELFRELMAQYKNVNVSDCWVVLRDGTSSNQDCRAFFDMLDKILVMEEVEEYTGRRQAICSLVNVENKALNESIKFTQESPADSLAFEGRISGINANHCDLCVHVFGDLSDGLSSVGPLFSPPQNEHIPAVQPAGVLKPGIPVILGIANVSDSSRALSLFGPRNIIGRALVLRKAIDSGQGEGTSSECKKIKETESTAEFVSIGIIGRATSQ